jgi:signal transduction histidine kinase
MNTEALELIVHDLKNAFGSLEGELLALSSAPTPAQARQAYERCAELRREFIQFLTVYGSGGKLHARCEDESPVGLLQALADALNGKAAAHGQVHIVVSASDAAPSYWYLDPRLVRLALDAALHNALRFARAEITLSARQSGDFLVLSVDDDGPGLGAADMSRHSTGLGTALCQRVAEAHTLADRHGHIQLQNKAQGGARFELWLP